MVCVLGIVSAVGSCKKISKSMNLHYLSLLVLGYRRARTKVVQGFATDCLLSFTTAQPHISAGACEVFVNCHCFR